MFEVKQLERFDAFQQGPGWVHAFETTSDPRGGRAYPPAYLKSERWYEVDEEAMLPMVWLDYNSDHQQSATVGDYSVNFTTGNSGFNNGYAIAFLWIH